jgi:ADP-ribose pyrophosphatase YjhB (NUDIX family)
MPEPRPDPRPDRPQQTPEAGPPDPDRPPTAGLLGRLQLRLGRIAITAANVLRPRLSLGVRLVAFDDEGRVFLVRHSYVPGLYLPCGAVDAGESCRAAMLREAHEEGGLTFPRPLELFHVYWNRPLGDRDHVILFVTRGARQTEAPSVPLEIRAAGFHPLDALPPDTTPSTRARLDEVLGRRPPSDLW